MTKKGGRIATWKRRWFVLGPEKLEYFTDTDKKVQKGSVALKDVIEVGHILHETRNYCIAIRTEKRLYVASCEDEATFDAWLAKLHEIQPKQLDAEVREEAREKTMKERAHNFTFLWLLPNPLLPFLVHERTPHLAGQH